jgi:hypothetical protein
VDDGDDMSLTRRRKNQNADRNSSGEASVGERSACSYVMRLRQIETVIDVAAKRGELIKQLEDAMAISDELRMGRRGI